MTNDIFWSASFQKYFIFFFRYSLKGGFRCSTRWLSPHWWNHGFRRKLILKACTFKIIEPHKRYPLHLYFPSSIHLDSCNLQRVDFYIRSKSKSKHCILNPTEMYCQPILEANVCVHWPLSMIQVLVGGSWSKNRPRPLVQYIYCWLSLSKDVNISVISYSTILWKMDNHAFLIFKLIWWSFYRHVCSLEDQMLCCTWTVLLKLWRHGLLAGIRLAIGVTSARKPFRGGFGCSTRWPSPYWPTMNQSLFYVR